MGSTGLMSARPEKTAAAASSYASTLPRLTGIDWASRLDRRSFHSSRSEPPIDFNRPLRFGSRSTLIIFVFELVMKSFHLTPRSPFAFAAPAFKARYANLVGASITAASSAPECRAQKPRRNIDRNIADLQPQSRDRRLGKSK